MNLLRGSSQSLLGLLTLTGGAVSLLACGPAGDEAAGAERSETDEGSSPSDPGEIVISGDGDDGSGDVVLTSPAVTDPGIIVSNPSASNPDANKLLLTGVIRDFSSSHEDFEKAGPPNAVIQGMVQEDLGADGKPVYGSTPYVTADTFAHWYSDLEGINIPVTVSLELTEESEGTFVFDSSEFFPIDGMGFGNEDNPRNYHFTSEFRSQFTYEGGEHYTFVGDDDLWVFINGKLAIDLGGTHSAYTASVSLDEKAAELGISRGATYELVLFHAERHTTESNFRIETTIKLESVVVK